jgi:hypothetical protein
MYDSSKIILGLAIFLVLITFPFWFSIASEKSGYVPEPKLPTNSDNCVESREYMKALHMDLLNRWRDSVVRDGNRVYVSSTGKRYEMSLTGTCLSCHEEKSEFCDSCHNFVGTSPGCWDCHIDTVHGESE